MQDAHAASDSGRPGAPPRPARGLRPLEALAWTALIGLAALVNILTILADADRSGRPIETWVPIVLETTSATVILLLVPALYWMHRRFPVAGGWRNLLAHAAFTLPFSLAHVMGMVMLRAFAFAALGRTYPVVPRLADFLYEYRKDAFSYLILSAVLLGLRHLLEQRRPAPAAEPAAEPPAAPAPEAPPPAPEPLRRFAVKRRDKEVLVEADAIAWIEAAGNYAVLHVGTERFEIRSSLARLEAELDPARFVRTHKSAIVNLAHVREVEPWVSGDYRIVLEDGGRVPLSRRFRARFERAVPVKS